MTDADGTRQETGRPDPDARPGDQRDDDARLDALRASVAETDAELVEVLARRLRLVREIGEIKRRAGRPVMDPAREAEVVRRAAAAARERGVDPELVRDVIWRVMAQARGVQDHRPSTG